MSADSGAEPWDEIFAVVAAPETGKAVRIYHRETRLRAESDAEPRLGPIGGANAARCGRRAAASSLQRRLAVNSLPLAGRRVLVTRAAASGRQAQRRLARAGRRAGRGSGAGDSPAGELCAARCGAAPARQLRLADSDQRQRGARARANARRALGDCGPATGWFARWRQLAKPLLLPRARQDCKSLLSRKPTSRKVWFRGLLQTLQNQTSRQRILLARAAVARDVIPDALRAAGAVVDVVDAYRNVMPEAAPERLRRRSQTESTLQHSPVLPAPRIWPRRRARLGLHGRLRAFPRFQLDRSPARPCAN